MTEDEERNQLFAALKAELYKRELSNSEKFDAAILAYSTAALGFSTAFLKDFVPILRAEYPQLLYGSWTLFVLSVVITTSSFMTSQLGIREQLKIAERYYLARDEDALKSPNRFARLTECLNWGSGIAFIVGIACTMAFVAANLPEASKMTEQRTGRALDGASVPQVQRVSERGAPVPTIQQITTQPPSSTPAPGGDSTGSSATSGGTTGSGDGTSGSGD